MLREKRTCSIIVSYGLILSWMGVIFYLSSVPGSGAVYAMPTAMLFERKIAHVLEYAILTLLFARLLRAHMPGNLVRALWISSFLTLLYAISDEVHQLFVFGRTGKVTDVLIDGIGIALACAAIVFFKQSHTDTEKKH